MNIQSMQYRDKRGLYFIGCIAPREVIWPEINESVFKELGKAYGEIKEVWPPTDIWQPPRSYIEEMGNNLSTVIIELFQDGSMDRIVEIKKIAMAIERIHSIDGKRTVNLNPGYLSEDMMCLATHKNSCKRVYLKDNVWIEYQFICAKGKIHTLPNTFAEYSHWDRVARFEERLNKLQCLADVRPETDSIAFKRNRKTLCEFVQYE